MTKATLLIAALAIGCNDARAEADSALQTRLAEVRAAQVQLNVLQSQIGAVTQDTERARTETENLTRAAADLQSDNKVLQAMKDGRGVHYVLHVSIRQVSYSFSISKQLRDAVNEEEFDLPTDRVTYEHTNPGDDLFESFRKGSAIFRGTLGSWRLKVVSKRIVTD